MSTCRTQEQHLISVLCFASVAPSSWVVISSRSTTLPAQKSSRKTAHADKNTKQNTWGGQKSRTSL